MPDHPANMKLTIDQWAPIQPHTTHPDPPRGNITDNDIATFMAALLCGVGDGTGWLQ